MIIHTSALKVGTVAQESGIQLPFCPSQTVGIFRQFRIDILIDNIFLYLHKNFR
jgi:hypothetical protein